jgi:hypothetical protein
LFSTLHRFFLTALSREQLKETQKKTHPPTATQKPLPSKKRVWESTKAPPPKEKNLSKSKSTIASNPTHPPTTLLKEANKHKTETRLSKRKENKLESKLKKSFKLMLLFSAQCTTEPRNHTHKNPSCKKNKIQKQQQQS